MNLINGSDRGTEKNYVTQHPFRSVKELRPFLREITGIFCERTRLKYRMEEGRFINKRISQCLRPPFRIHHNGSMRKRAENNTRNNLANVLFPGPDYGGIILSQGYQFGDILINMGSGFRLLSLSWTKWKAVIAINSCNYPAAAELFEKSPMVSIKTGLFTESYNKKAPSSRGRTHIRFRRSPRLTKKFADPTCLFNPPELG